MPGTLLVIDPAGNKIDGKKMLGGALWDDTTKVVRVPTNNASLSSFSGKAAYADIVSLNETLLANPGTPSVPTKIVTHSRGGSIASTWFRVMGPGSAIDPATLKWYICGCPDMKFTGAVYLWPDRDKPTYPGDGTKCGGTNGGEPHDANCPFLYPSQHGGWGVGSGIPATMPWDVTWIANQYDGWADCPINYEDVDELDERVTFLGVTLQYPWFDNTTDLAKILSRLRSGDTSPHNSEKYYYKGPLDGAGTVTYTDPAQPTQKYRWRVTYPMPYAYAQRMIRFWARAKDMKYRPIWEPGWDRPVTMPLPDYTSVPSWIPLEG